MSKLELQDFMKTIFFIYKSYFITIFDNNLFYNEVFK